jgi:uncharacterized phosphatase
MMKTIFYLMRHAEADYSRPTEWNTRGWGFDLAPLSKKGVKESKLAVASVRKIAPDYIICSSAARALETTAHIIRELGIPFSVEFDIHEWVPDHCFEWSGIADVREIERDFDSKEGVHTQVESERWESFKMMKERMNRTLKKYDHHSKVLVVCHSLLMHSVTGKKSIENTEIIEYQLE